MAAIFWFTFHTQKRKHICWITVTTQNSKIIHYMLVALVSLLLGKFAKPLCWCYWWQKIRKYKTKVSSSDYNVHTQFHNSPSSGLQINGEHVRSRPKWQCHEPIFPYKQSWIYAGNVWKGLSWAVEPRKEE
jgi:hypothetical protein